MNRHDKTRLQDMIDAAQKAQSFISGKERHTLESNNFLLGFAVVRAIEIIGGAASKVTIETRMAFPQINWSDMIGMRNRIAHDYLHVDYDIVWQVAVVEVPPLIAELENILRELD